MLQDQFKGKGPRIAQAKESAPQGPTHHLTGHQPTLNLCPLKTRASMPRLGTWDLVTQTTQITCKSSDLQF